MIMNYKQISNQIKQSSLSGYEGVLFIQKKMENTTRFTEGYAGEIVANIFIIDKKDRDGIKAEDTFYIGQQSGKTFFNSIRLEYAILYKSAEKGDFDELRLVRANVGGYGEDLSGLVKLVNYKLKEGKENIYLFTGLKSFQELIKKPLPNMSKIINDYVEDMKRWDRDRVENYHMESMLKSHKIRKPIKKYKHKFVCPEKMF